MAVEVELSRIGPQELEPGPNPLQDALRYLGRALERGNTIPFRIDREDQRHLRPDDPPPPGHVDAQLDLLHKVRLLSGPELNIAVLLVVAQREVLPGRHHRQVAAHVDEAGHLRSLAQTSGLDLDMTHVLLHVTFYAHLVEHLG